MNETKCHLTFFLEKIDLNSRSGNNDCFLLIFYLKSLFPKGTRIFPLKSYDGGFLCASAVCVF